ncbi:MAG: hypothetical protein AAB215_05060 [Planctomycetota bacterium]
MRIAAASILVVGLVVFVVGLASFLGVRTNFQAGLAQTRKIETSADALEKRLEEPLALQKSCVLRTGSLDPANPDLETRWKEIPPIRMTLAEGAGARGRTLSRMAAVPASYQPKAPFDQARAAFQKEAEEFSVRFHGLIERLARSLRKFDRIFFGRGRIAGKPESRTAEGWVDLSDPEGPISFREKPQVFVLGRPEGDHAWRTAAGSVSRLSEQRGTWVLKAVAARPLHRVLSETEIGVLWFAMGVRAGEE